MSDTPLYDSLKSLEQRRPLRFDMPSHHGKPLPYFAPADWTALDWTEHNATGDLFTGGDCIEAAEQRWAERWEAEGCLFLTGGSTEGVHTALHLCCKPGDCILADRGSHRSLWNGLALLDVEPVFLPRPWDGEREISGPIDPAAAEALWDEHPEAKALFVTSPTYYGVLSDIPALAAVAHRHGGVLIVDCAHGAHLPWVGLPTPCQQGADLTILSAHKELPAPGQSALLLYRGFSPERVRQAGRIYGSSSPSYVMMAAMDAVRGWLDETGAYAHLTQTVLPPVRRRLERETAFRLTANDDPARLVLSTRGTGCTGFQALERLEQADIFIEMADLTHLVLITSCLDNEADFDRLITALHDLFSPAPLDLPPLPTPPPLPPRVCSLRRALFSPREERSLKDCAGLVSAEQIAPYPPGVPIVLPGEQIEKKHLAYLQKIGYNISQNGIVCSLPPAL
ncbi:MAG: aminotransferase class I/II-fold pyridoxal phosphate-dependent enzyme [Oscillospiraceae bacterium]|nr:aminotransferase class I/II-fold pyridoxal phosphate-dependent enzyme [Oscillospiraceae bacterium]